VLTAAAEGAVVGEGAVVSDAVCASFADEHFRDVTSVSVMAGPGLGAGDEAVRFGNSDISGELRPGTSE
jgi:hypothetical protein